MSVLRVSIDVPGGPQRRWRVPATVRALDSDATQEIVVTTGARPLAIENLSAGRYLVEAYMPSGELLRRTVSLAEGTLADVRLGAKRSPHEWLETSSRMIAPNRFRSPPASAAAQVDLSGIFRVNVPDPFHTLASFLYGKLPLGARTVLPSMVDDDIVLVDIAPEPLMDHRTSGVLLVVPHGATSRAVALPTTWYTTAFALAHFEVVVNRGTGKIATTVKDDEFAPMLAYLASGQSQLAARALREQALEMLSEKMTNPFAAAAGGYVMLQQALRGIEPDKRWRGWIRNLANWFPSLPDGAILRGSLLVNGLRADGDAETPEQWFRRAADLGAPLFTTGLSLLLDGMFACIPEDPRMEFVRKLAAHVVRSEPFTTLRVEESP